MDLQTIIDAMGCFETKQKPCDHCDFNPSPGMRWAYGCQKGERDIIEMARSALRILQEVVEDDQHMASAVDCSNKCRDGHVPDGAAGGERT